MSTFWRRTTFFTAKWADNLHPGSLMTSRSTPDGSLHKISYPSVGGDWWRNTCRPWTLEKMGWGEMQHCSRWCGPFGGSRQSTRALAVGSNSRSFSWPWRKGQSCTRQNGRQRLCATNHEVVSVGDIKRTEGIEHSPIRGGGCSRERSLIHTNAVRWDGRTKHGTL